MILLLTNDDGLNAPGLEALENELRNTHDVWTVAPDREMSGQSHSITLNEGLKLNRFPDQRFAVHGTPVDCVSLSFQALLPGLPDLVISGINKGPNLGTDILYSGTCAAAREAALRGIPSVAVSFASFTGPWEYGKVASFLSGNLGNLINMWDEDCFININWPANYQAESRVVITRPGKRRYKDERVSFRSPRGGEYWFMQPAAIASSDDDGTDSRTIINGDISVSPVAVEPSLAPSSSIHDKMEWRGI
ncbi:MAG: 5'/3'-nucleotidase SurE [Spirochaetaceae bacterium]|nr:5'/3'-nucleotidase SurE [Spirochaetaceae bacterium]